jgi:hypothetical protein
LEPPDAKHHEEDLNISDIVGGEWRIGCDDERTKTCKCQRSKRAADLLDFGSPAGMQWGSAMPLSWG